MIWVATGIIIGGLVIAVVSLREMRDEQRAIAKALFARIPLREPTEQGIDREAKEDLDWDGMAARQPRLHPTGEIKNAMVRQRVRDRIYDRQRAPKFS